MKHFSYATVPVGYPMWAKGIPYASWYATRRMSNTGFVDQSIYLVLHWVALPVSFLLNLCHCCWGVGWWWQLPGLPFVIGWKCWLMLFLSHHLPLDLEPGRYQACYFFSYCWVVRWETSSLDHLVLMSIELGNWRFWLLFAAVGMAGRCKTKICYYCCWVGGQETLVLLAPPLQG